MFEEDLNVKHAKYEDDKPGCDFRAFVKVDTDKDGKLQEDEVVEALTPETAVWLEMHKALGLVDEPDTLIDQFLKGWVKHVHTA